MHFSVGLLKSPPESNCRPHASAARLNLHTELNSTTSGLAGRVGVHAQVPRGRLGSFPGKLQRSPEHWTPDGKSDGTPKRDRHRNLIFP